MEVLNKELQAQFEKMCSTGKLFRSTLNPDRIWELYLKGFGNDPKFRDPESSVHNCNQCKNFIRRYGNIVALDDDLNIVSLFNISTTSEYQKSMDLMDTAIKSSGIGSIFIETFTSLNSLPYESCKKDDNKFQLGVAKNVKRYTKEEAEKYGVVKPNEIRTFHHFNLQLPAKFVNKSGKSIEAIAGEYKSNYDVFKRGMKEISLDTLELVRDLINQGSLLNGESYLKSLNSFITKKKDFNKQDKLDNWCWVNSYDYTYAKFRNTLIGVLCTELAEEEELNKACRNWNKRVDPANYMRAVAPITEAQKNRDRKFIEDNGYLESFNRRFATLDDIKASEIKHMNVDETVKKVSIFDNITTKSRHKRNEFKNIEEVHIDKFMKDVLPSCSSVELYLENKHESNFVTLTTSEEDCKPMFKWSNPYSWTYKNNLAGKSMIKEAVKNQGGRVDGVLRFSIMWSEGNSIDNSDLDAHCVEPDSNIIYFRRTLSSTGGNLDIDITQPLDHKKSGKRVVENITYPSLEKMKDGSYLFQVNQYQRRSSEGFKAEIEFNGELYEYAYDSPVIGKIDVARVTLKNGEFTIEHILPSSSSSTEIYNIETKQFHKVNLMCLSPNYWGDNEVGNKHYFFILDNCKADMPIRSFHPENLNAELTPHRKTLQRVSDVTMLEPVEDQLSGLGFNATVRDSVILKLKGNFKRIIKVNF